jgi:outer membrane protein TolC
MRLAVGSLLALVATSSLAAAQGTYPSASPTPTPTSTHPRLELSLDEAVKRALENNADIAIERFAPEGAAQSVREVEGGYDPFLAGGVTWSSNASRAGDRFAGVERVDTDQFGYNAAVSKLLATGGSVRLNFSSTRTSSNVATSTFNPSYRSDMSLSLTQPLLRNFFIDSTRQSLRIAKKNREISDVQFRQTVLNTTATVKALYYDLLYAIDNLQAQVKSRDLARKQLDENQIKVRVGTLAPLDVVAAEAEVASREEGVIVAEAAIRDAEDTLKQALFPANDPATWALEIVPTDRPSAEPTTVDADGAVTRALEGRTDMIAARKQLENADISVAFARNQTMPGVDLVASYGSNGLGGTGLQRDPVTGEIIATFPGGASDAFSQVFGRDFPSWSVGVNVSYPLRNRSAAAQSARVRIARDQAAANLRRLELQVVADVRSAVRAVETNSKRIETTRASRVLAERRLDAENKRFAAGMSTNYVVTQAQRDLALAEVAELRAIADYRKSLVAFERVQEAGGSGVSFVSTSARSTASTRASSTTSSTGSFQ